MRSSARCSWQICRMALFTRAMTMRCRNALRLVKEGGAEAIKLEGGHKRVPLVKRLVDEEISVMGHIGLTPQSINQLGAYRVQGKTPKAAQQLIDDAKAMEDAGAFAVVLEVVPREIAK